MEEIEADLAKLESMSQEASILCVDDSCAKVSSSATGMDKIVCVHETCFERRFNETATVCVNGFCRDGRGNKLEAEVCLDDVCAGNLDTILCVADECSVIHSHLIAH